MYEALIFGGIAGLAVGLTGYAKAIKENPKESFSTTKLGLTVIISGLFGGFGSFFNIVSDPMGYAGFGAAVEVAVNRFYTTYFKK